MNDGDSQSGQMITLTASRGMGSRTEMGDIDPTTNKRLIYWNADMAEDGKARERIYVGSSQNPSISGVLYLNPSSLEGDPTTGTFTGFVFGDPSKLDYSVYPVPENGIIDLTTRSGKYVDAPMIGDIKSGNVEFKNTCAIREVNIPGITGQDFELSANAGGDALKLGATAVVRFDPNNNNKPYLDFTSTGNVVKVENVPNDVFYVPFEITKNTKANVIFSGKASSQTAPINITEAVDLSKAKPGVLAESGAKELHCVNGEIVVPPTKGESDFENKAPTTSEGEEKESTPTYTMEENVNSTNLTTIPSAENVAVQIKASEEATSTNPQEKVLSITSVPQNVNTLIFTETVKTDSADDGNDNEGNESEQPTPTEAKQKVTISLPETAAGKTLDLNMPNSTVNVQSKSGEDLNINKVIASTADNTFIIGSGVSIKELVAMKGSIEVSGEVENIIKGNGNHYGKDKVKVKVKKGGKIPSNINKNDFEVEYEDGDVPPVVKPEDGPRKVSTMAQLMSAINDGVAEIVLTKTVSLTDHTSLNLNDKVLTLSEDFVWDGNAAIKSEGYALTINGVIEGCQKTVSDKYLIDVKNASNVGLTNATLITNGVGNAVNLKDTKFNMDDSSISALNGYAVNVVAETNAVQVSLGTKTGVGIKGNIGFCNNYTRTGSRLEVGEHSSIEGKLVTSGSNLKGLYIYVDPDANVDITKGWPNLISTFDALKEELINGTKQVVTIIAPITITESIDLMGKTLVIDEVVWRHESQPIAAITISGTSQNPIDIQGSRTGKIEGSTTKYDGKYLIKSTHDFELFEVALTASGRLNGIEIENSVFFNTSSTIKTDKTALRMIGETSFSAMHMNGNTMTGFVEIINNYNAIDSTTETLSEPTSIYLRSGTITGNVSVAGSFYEQITVTMEQEAAINANLHYPKDATKEIRVIGNRPNGSGWPDSGDDNTGGGEVIGNTITIENLGLAQALASSYPNAVTEGKLKIDEVTGFAIVGEDFEAKWLRGNLRLRDASAITSLDDLEKFKSITTVSLVGTSLQTADFSKCTNLTEVHVNGTSLSSIDITGLNNLEILDCSNSAFTNLTLSSESLETFICRSNQLNALDITKLPNLKVLDCSDNQISSLILHNNLSSLDCSGNELTSLNVSDIPLAELYCLNNSLTDLDVSQNDELETLQCGNQNAGTTYLNLGLGTNKALRDKWVNIWYFYDGPVNNNVKAYYNDTLIEFNGGVQQGSGSTGAPNFGIEEI